MVCWTTWGVGSGRTTPQVPGQGLGSGRKHMCSAQSQHKRPGVAGTRAAPVPGLLEAAHELVQEHHLAGGVHDEAVDCGARRRRLPRKSASALSNRNGWLQHFLSSVMMFSSEICPPPFVPWPPEHKGDDQAIAALLRLLRQGKRIPCRDLLTIAVRVLCDSVSDAEPSHARHDHAMPLLAPTLQGPRTGQTPMVNAQS